MWLLDKDWRPGYCDYYRHPGQVRVRVSLWLRVQEIENAFVVPPRRLRRVIDYVRAYGFWQTVRKVRSRLAEKGRNRKYVVFGCGELVETDVGSSFAAGDAVAFLAPFHPACVDAVCLAEALVRKLPKTARVSLVDSTVLEGSLEVTELPWDKLAGWSEFSSLPLEPRLIDRFFDVLLPRLGAGTPGTQLKPRRVRPETRPSDPTGSRRRRPEAVLFGLGHYAKNVVLPRISRYVSVSCIHELDPAQIGKVASFQARLRTSAYPEKDESYDAYLICGYHHTHAPIAVHALRAGAVAVVEKPAATTPEQLVELLTAMSEGTGRLFIAFQRRYTIFNEYLRRDLWIKTDTPIHCQVIAYEIPVPAKHWYRWPSSRSRIVSNGCHWIDHFLFLNGFSQPASIEVSRRRNGDVSVMMDLENGAGLTLTLTEHGSSRMGVREHVLYRAGSRTATIVDQSHYQAESSHRQLRKTSITARSPFDRMYAEIGRRIAAGTGGESLHSVRVSTAAVLTADEQLGCE